MRASHLHGQPPAAGVGREACSLGDERLGEDGPPERAAPLHGRLAVVDRAEELLVGEWQPPVALLHPLRHAARRLAGDADAALQQRRREAGVGLLGRDD